MLLVILIFLMLTTTYSKFTSCSSPCPWPMPSNSATTPKEVIVAVAAMAATPSTKTGVEGKAWTGEPWRCARAASAGKTACDHQRRRHAAHQSVVTVMEAPARRADADHVRHASTAGARARQLSGAQPPCPLRAGREPRPLASPPLVTASRVAANRNLRSWALWPVSQLPRPDRLRRSALPRGRWPFPHPAARSSWWAMWSWGGAGKTRW